MKKVILFVVLFSACVVSAQTAGKSGLSFLKLGFGARNVAMGDLGVVNSKDVTALNYNPALLSRFSSPEILFTHNQWIEDTRSEYLGVSFKLLGLPWAVGVNTTTISDIEIRTRPGEAEGKFNANYFAGSLSTGLGLTENISAGLTVKYLYEGLLSDEANGLGFDLGLLYESPIEGLSFGAAFRNLGSMNSLRNEETKLPSDFRLGASYSDILNDFNSSYTLGAEVQKYLVSDDTHINLGGELLYEDMIALRAGYQTGFESKGFTAGLGIKWYNLNFDYAFTPFLLDLGSSHTISLKFKF
ncbi:MAG: PorV/PorQ family protein [Ignavibacteria bacterium]|nr:PorV/PorQ family protein [Ignavibacteria bacterium]MCU7501796.1 PorV/PorQ family protein [Ignavibacteria bacterium]MCU7518283.1 PorV/PorQ family protein [Ignavibacteria bacterium]